LGEIAAAVVDALPVAEEKRLVPNDRSANRDPELIVEGNRLAVGEYVARAQSADAIELIEAAVQAIRSRPQTDVGHRAARAAQLRFVVAGGDIDGGQRFDGRNQNLQAIVAEIVVDSLYLIIVRLARLAVDPRRERVLRIVELGMDADHAVHARRQVEQALEVP